MFSVNFYREENGEKPVGDFIRTLDIKTKAKVISDLNCLEMLGNEAREPLSKCLEDSIFELRSNSGHIVVRILFFFDEEEIIVVTNGFVKKQQKTPHDEIILAKRRRAIYMQRKKER